MRESTERREADRTGAGVETGIPGTTRLQAERLSLHRQTTEAEIKTRTEVGGLQQGCHRHDRMSG